MSLLGTSIGIIIAIVFCCLWLYFRPINISFHSKDKENYFDKKLFELNRIQDRLSDKVAKSEKLIKALTDNLHSDKVKCEECGVPPVEKIIGYWSDENHKMVLHCPVCDKSTDTCENVEQALAQWDSFCHKTINKNRLNIDSEPIHWHSIYGRH